MVRQLNIGEPNLGLKKPLINKIFIQTGLSIQSEADMIKPINMDRTLVLDCNNKIDQVVKICGWVQVRRDHGKIVFLDILDRSGVLQVILTGDQAEDLHSQDVVCIEGKVTKRPEKLVNPNLETGSIELQGEKLEILAKAEELPFDMGGKELNVEIQTLLDFRPLTLRHPKVLALFKIQEVIVESFRKTLKDKQFTEVFVPTIVASATEGGAEVFQIDYYGKKAYLAQSPQLYKQIMVGIFERVFTLAHAYRAEPSVTTRHLAEYISLDAEMGFISSFEEIMDVVEQVITDMLKNVVEKCQIELKLLEIAVPEISQKIPRLKMRDAQQIVFERTGRDHREEPDLDPADEKELCEWAKEQTGAPFVFITNFPTSKRPFYTMPDPENPDRTLSFDLLGVNEEWVTGGQRINDYQYLLKRLEEKGGKKESFEIYLQAFKYGMPPEGGFAMGLERLTKDMLGVSNVREASLFPRDMERVDIKLSTIKR